MKEQILVRITGQDRPGLTASVMEILAKYDTQILDIGQADIHATLSLGILIRVDEENSGRVMKELLFKATELQVNIGFSPITDEEYEAWVGRQGKNRYILTIVGRHLSAQQIASATRVIAHQGFNIDSILRLSGRTPVSPFILSGSAVLAPGSLRMLSGRNRLMYESAGFAPNCRMPASRR